MTDNITSVIREYVIKQCQSEDNIYGIGAWTHHISSVEKNAVMLAKEYNADVEVVTIAALLHDIASVTNKDYTEEHHIHGARIAEELLTHYGYDSKEKLELIKKCILNHRGSVLNAKNSIEEICVADADAMAHFDNIPSLFSMVYKEKGMGIDEGESFVKSKLQRSYNKLSDRSRELYKEKYNQTMSIFKNND